MSNIFNKKIWENIQGAAEKNILEKRAIFEHFSLLIGTILGFSVGLTVATEGEPNCFLLISWIIDIIALIISSIFLIIEAESRYYRTFVSANKQLELINKTEEEFNREVKNLWEDMYNTFLYISSGKNIKEKIYIAFAKYQRKIEISFYLAFLLSLIFLVISFFQ